ncbi:MAG: hypothetical protein GWO24_20270 [Akkermansiaceae bacterium]|nr:hypothetical protein [Akkermansiaceae bacterium]
MLATGDYEVEIHYSCPEKDVGSSFEIAFNEARLKATVTEAHDPPLRGAESDRTPNRGSESYVKDWRPLKAGTIRLEKGRGTFTLRALEIPGEQVMDVRLVILRKR